MKANITQLFNDADGCFISPPLRYIVNAGSAEGGAGSGSETSVLGRISATLRGRKTSAEPIAVRGVDGAAIAAAAKATEGFSGEGSGLDEHEQSTRMDLIAIKQGLVLIIYESLGVLHMPC